MDITEILVLTNKNFGNHYHEYNQTDAINISIVAVSSVRNLCAIFDGTLNGDFLLIPSVNQPGAIYVTSVEVDGL